MGPTVFVSTSSLEHNLQVLRKEASGAAAFPVIKANAYGHDAAQVACLLSQKFSPAEVPLFCVARCSELGALLSLQISRDFLVLSGVDWEWHLRHSAETRVLWTLTSARDLQKWFECGDGVSSLARVHLIVNSGMNRLGFRPEELRAVLPELHRAVKKGLRLEGVFTHFWNSDGFTAVESTRQVEIFRETLADLAREGLVSRNTWIHAENSAALRWHLPIEQTLPGAKVAFRPGIHLWGCGLDRIYAENDTLTKSLRPALALGAPIRQVQILKPGEGLSYGWRQRLDRLTCVATVPLGYADGVPRSLSWDGRGEPKAHLAIEGHKCPILSTVTMDMVMVEITEAIFKKFQTGQEIFAYWIHPDHQSIYEVSERIQTITYESLCMISSRVPRMQITSWENLP